MHHPFHQQGFSSAELRFRLPPIDYAATCYRPHFVADNSGEYLGVEFINGEVSAPQQDALVEVKPLFDVDYSPLLRRGAGRCSRLWKRVGAWAQGAWMKCVFRLPFSAPLRSHKIVHKIVDKIVHGKAAAPLFPYHQAHIGSLKNRNPNSK